MKIEEGKYYRTRDGRKVGPMVSFGVGSGYLKGNVANDEERVFRTADGGHDFQISLLDLVSEWTDEPTGPVRERLVKEIVPGFYGIVCVGFRGGDKDKPEVSVAFAGHSADELRAAAATLLEIADALVKP